MPSGSDLDPLTSRRTASLYGDFPDLNPLTGRTTTPFYGTTPSGGSVGIDSSSFGSGVDWSKVAIGGAGLLSSLFAGNSQSPIPTVNEIQGRARTTGQQGSQLFQSGQADLTPSLDYFKQLLSGNPQAVLEATQPERGRVIDQYDAARRSAGQFTPRGGGQASASQTSRAKEASDLGNLTASARGNAANQLSNIALQETQTGLSAEEQATQQLAQTLQPILQQEQQDQASTSAIYSGLGLLLAAFL